MLKKIANNYYQNEFRTELPIIQTEKVYLRAFIQKINFKNCYSCLNTLKIVVHLYCTLYLEE